MSVEQRRRGGRNWALAFAPSSLTGGPEGLVFAVSCLVALILVFLGDLHTGGLGSIGAIGFIPVVAAGWLLSWRLAALVAAAAVALRVVAVMAGVVPVLTGTTVSITIPILVLLARLAADAVVRAGRTESRAERLRAEGDRLAALEQAKSEFLRLASHELRGPVGVLGGYVSMLDDGTLGELPDSARAIMPILSSKVRSMSLLVDQMLETARLEDQRLQLRVQRTDLRELAAASVADMLPVGGEHRIELRTSEEPVLAEVDRTRFATIVSNLLDNAIKYSPAGGRIECDVHRRGSDALVSVSDHGLGIAPQDQKRLFSRFTRIQTEETVAIDGTGLGLYLSRELARLHGGELTVRSREGVGSTFTLRLPASASARGSSGRKKGKVQP